MREPEPEPEPGRMNVIVEEPSFNSFINNTNHLEKQINSVFKNLFLFLGKFGKFSCLVWAVI